MDKTAKLIPINILEKILYDGNYFKKFVDFFNNDKTALFEETSLEEYITSLNNYFEYHYNFSNTLSKEVFERINYLNTIFKFDIQYPYDEYLNKTNNLISIDTLLKIINDENYFNKFMDFENNLVFFNNISIEKYLRDLFDLIIYYRNNNLEIPDSSYDRFLEIRKKYSTLIKNYHEIDGYNVDEEMNEELFNKIITAINPDYDKFTIARAIYIELCKQLSYSTTFIAYQNNDKKNPIYQKIYNEPIDSVTLENNEITCKTFSEIYSKLLCKFGFNAKVSGNEHKYVVFDCDGTLLKADATEAFSDFDEHVRINDLTRIQLGLKTCGYTCLEDEKDISGALLQADINHNYHVISLNDEIAKLEEQYLKTTNQYAEFLTIEEKFEMLNHLSSENILKGFELLRYVKNIFNKIFTSYEKHNISATWSCKRINDETYLAGIVFSMMNIEGYDYYTFFETEGINKIDKEVLEEQISSKDIVFVGEYGKIYGIGEVLKNGNRVK